MWSYADTEDMLRPYSNIDMKLWCRVCHMSFTLEMLDALDEQYELIQRYPMPGRNYKFTLAYSF